MDTEYLKRVGKYVLSAVLCLCLVIYLGYHIWQSFSTEVVTQPARTVSYEQVIEAEGVIFRTESPIENTGGAKSVIPTVLEGEHVKKNAEVAKLYSDYSPDTVARIAQIEEQAELLSQITDDGGMSLQDTAKTDKEIYSMLSLMREYSDGGNAEEAIRLRRNLISAVSERALLTGSYADTESELAKLEKEKAQLVSKLGSMLGAVYTPASGYYYSETDGYENIFRAELLEDITLTELRELLLTQPEDGNTAGKTVTKSRWYLVCMLDVSEKSTYAPGMSCKVGFKGSNTTVAMDVETVLYDKEGSCVILSTNMMPEGMDFTRTQDVELVKCEYSGIKVPVSALRMVNGETGVYILDVTTVSFRRTEIIYKTENYYIVELPDDSHLLPEEDNGEGDNEETAPEADEGEQSKTPPLRLYDNIIVEGTGLYEGMTVGA